jgi:hypothetical protein
MVLCRAQRLKEPVNFIRAEWIRPEDIGFYEALGLESIKLIDRRLPTEALLKIITAYLKRSYPGNLADLLPAFSGRSFNLHNGWLNKLLGMGNFFSVDFFNSLKYFNLLSKLEIFIDNSRLDGFLKHLPETCDFVSCGSCGYCRAAADQAVKIDKNYRRDTAGRYEHMISELFRKGLAR